MATRKFEITFVAHIFSVDPQSPLWSGSCFLSDLISCFFSLFLACTTQPTLISLLGTSKIHSPWGSLPLLVCLPGALLPSVSVVILMFFQDSLLRHLSFQRHLFDHITPYPLHFIPLSLLSFSLWYLPLLTFGFCSFVFLYPEHPA